MEGGDLINVGRRMLVKLVLLMISKCNRSNFLFNFFEFWPCWACKMVWGRNYLSPLLNMMRNFWVDFRVVYWKPSVFLRIGFNRYLLRVHKSLLKSLYDKEFDIAFIPNGPHVERMWLTCFRWYYLWEIFVGSTKNSLLIWSFILL